MVENLTIYIPTYKRNDLLFQAIESTQILGNVKVIISDNNEDVSISNEIINFTKSFKSVVYHKNRCNIGLDRNMIGFLELCDTKYCLLLGDDDLISIEFLKIIEFLSIEVDFFVLNNNRLPTTILDLNTDSKKTFFFESVWDKMPFGTLIINVKKAQLVKHNINKYIGTYHAYSAIPWEILFSESSVNKVFNVCIEVVDLGIVEKTWKQNTLEIHLKSIPTWFSLLPVKLNTSVLKALYDYKKNTFTFSFFKHIVFSDLSKEYKDIIHELPLGFRIKCSIAKVLNRLILK